MNEIEQWKLDGNCEKCRRDPYCTKECKPRKKMVEAKMTEILAKAFNKAMAKMSENQEEKKENGNNGEK